MREKNRLYIKCKQQLSPGRRTTVNYYSLSSVFSKFSKMNVHFTMKQNLKPRILNLKLLTQNFLINENYVKMTDINRVCSHTVTILIYKIFFNVNIFPTYTSNSTGLTRLDVQLLGPCSQTCKSIVYVGMLFLQLSKWGFVCFLILVCPFNQNYKP